MNFPTKLKDGSCDNRMFRCDLNNDSDAFYDLQFFSHLSWMKCNQTLNKVFHSHFCLNFEQFIHGKDFVNIIVNLLNCFDNYTQFAHRKCFK